MSIEITTVEVTYDGNAVASQYAYTFRIDKESAVEVYVSGVQKTLGTDYTVSGVGQTNGGTVSFVASLVPGSGTGNVKIFRNTDPVHAISYSEGGSLPVSNAEASWDRLAMNIQEHRDYFERTIKIPRTHTASTWNASLPDPGVASNVAGTKIIAFRGSGVVLVEGSLGSGFSPMTTQGDLAVYDTGATRLPVGSTGALLHVHASTDSLIAWGSAPASYNQAPYWTGSTVGWSLPPLNRLGLEASTTSSALTFTLLAENGNPVSTANQVGITFPASVASTGHYSTIYTASVIQITLNEGATLNIGAASSGRAYLYGCNDGGEIKLGLAREALWGNGELQTTTAITSAADSAKVLYTVSALTSVPVTLIGVTEFTAAAVAGSWESTPEVLRVWQPGMRKTGDVVQSLYVEDITELSTTTAIPVDTSIPTSSEGEEYRAADSVTPTNALNEIRVMGIFNLSASTVSDHATVTLFKDANAAATKTQTVNIIAADNVNHCVLYHREIPGTVSAVTWKWRVGPNSGTTYVNRTATADLFSSTLVTTFRYEEVYT